jgi:hypothetical protein
VWLFGGFGWDSAGTNGYLNDLWKYSNGEWTWMGGFDTGNQKGIYGTQGTPSTGYIPGGRGNYWLWVDASGTVWLFGGYGYDSNGTLGNLNDLWKFNDSNGQWTWITGSNVANQIGTYGVKGEPSGAVNPGARNNAVGWVDSSGNLWLFGGLGYDSTGTVGRLNDLWKFSNSDWEWVSGSNLANQAGTYGTMGTPNPGNVPGGREGPPMVSIDAQGNFWLFGGGKGYDSAGTLGDLSDIWKYEP